MREMHNDEKKAWKEKIEVLDRQFRERIAEKEDELEEQDGRHCQRGSKRRFGWCYNQCYYRRHVALNP